MSTIAVERAGYELRFESLFERGRALAFPCDAEGRVDLDALGRATLNDYFYARTFIGREFSLPSIRHALGVPG